jgi:predicted nucleotidyltransferase
MTVAQAEVLRQVRIPIPMEAIEAFCRKWEVREFALFGSVLRDDFRPDSDVDVLVTFDEGAHPTLFDVAGMEIELEKLFQRRVDLSERGGFDQCRNPTIRHSVLDSLSVIYAR